MAQIHGRATIRINGTVYESEDDATFSPGGTKNTTKMIGDKPYHTQTKIPSKVTGKFPVTSETDLVVLQGLSEQEITFESDTGAIYHIASANQENEIELGGGDSGGTVELSFTGSPATKI